MNELIKKGIEALVEDRMRPVNNQDTVGRFDALVEVRDAAVAMVNNEREAEKRRVSEARDRLKNMLKEQQQRLRSVSVVTKPRGSRKAATATTSAG